VFFVLFVAILLPLGRSVSVSRDGVFVRGALQQIVNLLVGCLRELLVPESDRMKRLGGAEADDLIDFRAQLPAGIGGSDGNGNDNAVWAKLS